MENKQQREMQLEIQREMDRIIAQETNYYYGTLYSLSGIEKEVFRMVYSYTIQRIEREAKEAGYSKKDFKKISSQLLFQMLMKEVEHRSSSRMLKIAKIFHKWGIFNNLSKEQKTSLLSSNRWCVSYHLKLAEKRFKRWGAWEAAHS